MYIYIYEIITAFSININTCKKLLTSIFQLSKVSVDLIFYLANYKR